MEEWTPFCCISASDLGYAGRMQNDAPSVLFTHTHTHIRTHAHTYMHTYMHTHARTQNREVRSPSAARHPLGPGCATELHRLIAFVFIVHVITFHFTFHSRGILLSNR